MASIHPNSIIATGNNGYNDMYVVSVTNKTDFARNISSVDSRMLNASDMADTRTHLGMLDLFQNSRVMKVPFLPDVMKNHDKMYVKGMNGEFTYDVALEIDKPSVIQWVDNGDYIGVDGSSFDLILSHEYSNGDILTYDAIDGAQVMVTDDEVVDEGGGFRHTVVLVDNDRGATFPKEKTQVGTQIFKIGSVQGEFDTQLSKLSGMPGMKNKVTLGYTLGDFTGVEVAWTMYADALKIKSGKDEYESSYLMESFNRFKHTNQIGDSDLIQISRAIGKTAGGKIVIDDETTRVSEALPFFAMGELWNMVGMKMMFAKGATIVGQDGSSKIINEGIYHQLRRGHRFLYNNAAELRGYIKQAADVIYAGTTIPIHLRRIKFRAGYDAYTLVREMFKKEFENTVPVTVDNDVLGSTPVLTGNDRYNKVYESYAIGAAFLNGIGFVEIEHDASLDYDFGDYVQRGYTATRTKRSWTLVAWDISSPDYSNVMDPSVQPKGVTIDPKSTRTNNLFIVKPEGMPDMNYGMRRGRGWGTGYEYSKQEFGSEFSCFTSMSAFIPDKGRVVIIERP